MDLLRSIYRLVAASLFGAQLFFAAVAAQKAFPAEVAALPRGDPRRTLAADLVGAMLAPLDLATLLLGGLLVVLAVVATSADPAGRRLVSPPARFDPWSTVPPLLAAAAAGVSAFVTTPAIHAMREAGRTGEPRFGMLHGLSSGLLLLEMALLLFAALRPAGRR